ncbi:Crp/Fnr family transcriptional regulator [Massilia sp. TWP1-3-3]|uniref:Crp/Fnr family transcriptional regulator n=1 Tax=Massilia sp. TWP1-3-3 TaxID=2804573 RepID=UPI003CE79682
MTETTQTLIDHLRSTIWARCLTCLEMARVERDCVEQFVPKGGFVCKRGEVLDHWTGIIDGLVKINNCSSEGKSVTFAGVPAGGWFGEGSQLKDETRKYDVVALRATRVARLPRATFEWLLEVSLPFNRFLLMQLNERLSQFIGLVENDRTLDVDTRVARCLAAMFNAHLYPGLEKEVQISQKEVGYLSGASRQRANQALQLLEREGLLRRDYGAIRVFDLDGLRHFQA